MATILLQAAGSALGGVFGPVGAVIGRAAGALAGSAIDRTLIGGSNVEGPRLAGARFPASAEGAGLARVYGTVRLAGTMIWATRFEEEVTRERQGGKGGGATLENYRYYGNFAFALCEGEIAGIRRVWADGREIDLGEIEMRVHRGSEDQMPDPLIAAKQGGNRAPAYRGTAYVVIERLPLERYGNRIPAMNFEVYRPFGRLERDIRAITVIPGATEHGYDPRPVSELVAAGEGRVMNRNVSHAESDWTASMDELQALCPNLERVALVCAWFGDDLRAGHCTIAPRVEVAARTKESRPWRVAGLTRGQARLVSRHDDAPAYGGSPSDASVVAAISDLKARGLEVFLYPFVMMDVPAGNERPDPWGPGGQPAYPWRGRITCDPAPGQSGSVDGTAEAAAQVAAFCGSAKPGGFSPGEGGVVYEGTDDGYRRFVLHHAHLASLAGGVDGFLLGSEMSGLTQVRDAAGGFPFVAALRSIARDVRAVLGEEVAISYGADWSEYFGYRPSDGSGDVLYNLDPLWADPAITAVCIDNYMPLADWRDDDLIGGNPDGFVTATDRDAMRRQITAGEGFDWYYESSAHRQARNRTPINDGAAGKSWVYRFKDLESWWANPHVERIGGIEKDVPTQWEPRSKPIWFTELGCSAVDHGANQPNVFPDPKSSAGGLPHFSVGRRSDLIQRRFLEAHFEHWTSAAAPAGMVDPAHVFVWTWDARPYPAFPADRETWSDGANWRCGHWLNGRLGTAPTADLIAAILADHGFEAAVVEDIGGEFVGYVQGQPAAARAMMEPILDLLQADAVESGGRLLLRSRTRRVADVTPIPAVVDSDGENLIELTRAQTIDLAREALLEHFDAGNDYETATARSRRIEVGGNRQEKLSLPATMNEETALKEIDLWLRDRWAGREAVRFAVPATMVGIEPGDVVSLEDRPQDRWVVTRLEDGLERRIEARAWTGGVAAATQPLRSPPSPRPPANAAWSPVVHILDLPVIEGADETQWARAAAYSRPWRMASLWCSPGETPFARRAELSAPARMGELTTALGPGRSGRFDRAARLECRLHFGGLQSVAELEVMNGANVVAVLSHAGAWEVLQFAGAEEVAPGQWRLSRLLRGQGGSEDAAVSGAPVGAPVVVLDSAAVPIGLRGNEIGVPLDWQVRRGSENRMVGTEMTAGLRALTPLSPVHLRAGREANGAVRLSWIRRGRFDADSWLGADIPLDVPRERYRVQILGPGGVKRSVEVETPAFVYDADSQTADFGGLANTLTVEVRQFGERVALGLPVRASFTL